MPEPILIAQNGNRTQGYRAKRIWTMTPGRPFLDDGVLLVDGYGQILEIGTYSRVKGSLPGTVTDLGPVSLAPGLINCHTHLEMSLSPCTAVLGQGFEEWAAGIISQQFQEPTEAGLGSLVSQMESSGTAFVCDISSRYPIRVATTLQRFNMQFHLCYEFFGFKQTKGQQLTWPQDLFSKIPDDLISAAGHALYSTHPSMLQLAKAWDSRKNRTFSIHLAEHTGELEFLATGRGRFADMLYQRVAPQNFVPPGISPVAYADQLGLLDESTLAVHCVHVTDEDLEILLRTRPSVCLCPRSNAAIGVGRAPWEKFIQAGVPLCLGTDGLCSNEDLDLFQEALFLARNATIPLTQHDLLQYMTTNPARLFGKGRFGALTPGKQARVSTLPHELESLKETR
ncbi:MAG: amidohydrolase family protein [Desulfovibrionales bacterium]